MSTEKLRFVITSGGTDVPIDDVRVISNVSSGTTGAFLAETALEHGHDVVLLRHKHARAPFEKFLAADPYADIPSEVARIADVLTRVEPLMAHFTDLPQSEFASYHEQLLAAIADHSVDVAILARAASDFGVAKAAGKISSHAPELVLKLEPLPKIISEVKRNRRDIFLVGFKFLADGTPPDKLIENAYTSLLRDKQDLTVANVGLMGTADLNTYLITMEKGVIPVYGRDNLQELLIQTIEQRFSRNHYRTKLTKVDQLPLPEDEVSGFLDDIHRIAMLSLFPEYLSGDREEFGFVAKRTDNGTLITGRGSSKSQAEVNDLALVTEADEANNVLKVESTGVKASLNANVAHLIFSQRPDIQYIIHSHISLPDADAVEKQSSPGTQEDWDRMKQLVQSGSNLIYQPGHGVLILLHNLDQLLPLLAGQNLYSKRPELYDVAYARFNNNPRFVEIVKQNLKPDGKYMDLCAGTGEVTRQLMEAGFTDIDLVDASENMLSIAKQKLPEVDASRYRVTRMEDIDDADVYDGIFIRQAVNYLSRDTLTSVFMRLKNALKPGGKLVFNTFTIDGLISGLKKVRRDEGDGVITLTQEGNLVANGRVYHGQRTEMYDSRGGYDVVYDFNVFSAHDRSTFEQALTDGGFTEIKVITEGRSIYFITS